MGFLTESNIHKQAKKGQGETNQRLDANNETLAAILAELQTQNRWLAHIAAQLDQDRVPVSNGQ